MNGMVLELCSVQCLTLAWVSAHLCRLLGLWGIDERGFGWSIMGVSARCPGVDAARLARLLNLINYSINRAESQV